MDKISKEQRQKTMQAIKSKGSKMENSVCKELWQNGIRFRRNVANLPGKPDIAIKKYRTVIFLDSCFWHKCTKHYRLPKSNTNFWKKKVERNAAKDEEINDYYINNGWNILRVWEHQLQKDFENTIKIIACFIDNAKKNINHIT